MTDKNGLTAAELALRVGCSERTVQRWRAAGLPCTDGRFRLDDVERWLADRPRARPSVPLRSRAGEGNAERAGDGATPSLAAATTRWRRARARLAELEVAEREGELMQRSDHIATMVHRAAALRRRLLPLGRRLAHELAQQPALVVQRRLEAEVTEILRDIAERRVVDPDARFDVDDDGEVVEREAADER